MTTCFFLPYLTLGTIFSRFDKILKRENKFSELNNPRLKEENKVPMVYLWKMTRKWPENESV